MRAPTPSRWIRRTALLFGALVLAAPLGSTAVAQAPAGWTQLQGDAAHTGYGSDAAMPPYREAWRFDPGLTGRFGVSPAVIAGELAVTVGPRAVYGVELETGEPAWEVPRAYGPSSSPAVLADVLVYTEGYGTNPPQEAFASATPSVSASPATPSAAASATPPPVPGDEGDAPAGSRVVAIDLGAREQIWDRPVELQAVSRTGVTVDDGVAYVGDDDGTVTAIDLATGEVAWTFEAPGPVVTAIAAADGSVAFATEPGDDGEGVLVALDASDGTETWRFDASGPALASIPAIAGGAVYVGVGTLTSNSVRAFDLSDGAERWSQHVGAQVSPLSVPVVADEVVYMTDISGQVHALSASTGDEAWDFAINGIVFRAGPVRASTALLVPTNRGSLLAIDTTTHDLVARAAAAGPQGHLGALAATPTVVVAVKGGHAPGLVGFEHDPDAPLIAEPSPTVLRPGAMLVNFAVAALPMLVALAVAGRWLRARLGPAFAEPDDVRGDVDVVDEPDA